MMGMQGGMMAQMMGGGMRKEGTIVEEEHKH